MSKTSCISHMVVATAACLSFPVAGPAVAGMGDPDPNFGDAGMVKAGQSGVLAFELADGRIVVAGQSYGEGDSDVAVNRLLATGVPDLSFGIGGRRLVDLPGIQTPGVEVAALQPDGKLVIGGTVWAPITGPYTYAARLDVEGALDATFGGGTTTLLAGTEPWYTSMLVMPNAEILLAISDWTNDRIDRLAPDGRYLGNLSAAIAPNRLAMRSDGRLIVSGYHRGLGQRVVMRIDAQGHVDETFGVDGFATVTAGYDDVLAVEPGGDRIILCGYKGVARLTPDGNPDTTFGAEATGYVGFGVGGVESFSTCEGLVSLQGGGIAYVAGRYGVTASGGGELYVGGLTTSGTVDTRFGGGSGFSAIEFGGVYLDPYASTTTSSFIATRDGNALLTALSYVNEVWVVETPMLVKINLGGESLTASMPPASAPSPTPSPTPPPNPIPAAQRDSSGGGALAGLDFALLVLLTMTGMARRKYPRDDQPPR